MNYNNNIYIIAKYIFYNIYLANIDVIIKEIKENSIEVAKKLKAIGMDKYKIAKVTDLSVEEIDNFDVEVDYEYISAEEDNRKIENSIKTQYTNEGKRENSIEVAKKLKAIGMDKYKIAKITSLPIEKIDNFDVEVDYEYISAEEDNRKIDNAIKTQYTNEGKKEVAKNLKLIGLDISKIAQVTNLSIEEIENIYNLYKDMS